MLTEIVTQKVRSPDQRPRTAGHEWVGIVVHHTGLPSSVPATESAWRKYHEAIVGWLSKKDDAYLSAHYQIGRFGEIVELVDPDKAEAYHAGKSSFWHPGKRVWAEDWNRHAIGIELLGDGNITGYSAEQYEALVKLCRALMERFPSISPTAVVGHEMIAPGRKSDPGKLFDWKRFYRGLYA